jgi:hypothetical protein
MTDDISSSLLVRTCTWVVCGNCSTNGVTQSGNYVKCRFARKGKDMYSYHVQHPNVIVLIQAFVDILYTTKYASFQAFMDILYTTKYASFLLCCQLYQSNLFWITFASIKLSLARDDLDNLCQLKCHSKLMSIICQEITK